MVGSSWINILNDLIRVIIQMDVIYFQIVYIFMGDDLFPKCFSSFRFNFYFRREILSHIFHPFLSIFFVKLNLLL